jgi:hypothetical protein
VSSKIPTDLVFGASCSSPEEMEEREVVDTEAVGESNGEFPTEEASIEEAVAARLADGLCRSVGAMVVVVSSLLKGSNFREINGAGREERKCD